MVDEKKRDQIQRAFLLILGLCYLLGCAFHVLDLFNLRLHLTEMPKIWKAWILYLMIFDLITAIGLFKKRGWGELAFLTVATSQLIAYTQFKDIFGDQKFLIEFHTTCLVLYILIKLTNRRNKTKATQKSGPVAKRWV